MVVRAREPNAEEPVSSVLTEFVVSTGARIQIMAQNILKAAQAYPGKRPCVLTGCEHLYILRKLQKGI